MTKDTETGTKKFPVIFFDLGRTLMRFHGEWAAVLEESTRSLAAALWEMGYEIEQSQFISSFGRHVLAQNVKRDLDMLEETAESILRHQLERYAFQDISPAQLKRALARMFAVSQQYWQVDEDSLPMLEALKGHGYRMAIISNAKDCDDVYQLLHKAQITSYFETVTISCEIGYRKPHPKIFEAALEKMGINPEKCVMVGDLLEADIAGANNMGMQSVWINPGAKEIDRTYPPSAKPDFDIQALREIPAILEKLNQ